MSTAKHILIVDDDKDLVASMKTFLEARSYAVETAHNGSEARASLAKQRPDLIVLDIMMDTDAEGFNLAYKLKEDPATRQIPIIIVSGFTDHLDSKMQSFEFIQGRDWPAAKFFDKPVNLSALAESVQRLITESEILEQAIA